MELMGRCCCLFFSQESWQFTRKNNQCMGRDGEWGQWEVMVSGNEPILLFLDWDFMVVEPLYLNPGIVKVRM